MIINGVRYPRLRKQGNAFYYDRGGKPRRWEPLGSHEAKALKRYRDIADEPTPAAGSIDQMLKETIEALEKKVAKGEMAAGTLVNYRSYRKHLAATFADPETNRSHPPEVLSQADILRYLNTCPRMTFRNEVGLLSLAYAHWMEQGRLTFNPCFGVRTKRKGSLRKRLFRPAELQAIIDKADERLAVAIELAYATGLRIGDCCRLRWADLAGIFELQKTRAPQTIESSDALEAILARARALQARVASLHVLCDRRGRRWRTGTLRNHWDDACAAAGVGDAHFHDIRATAITEMERQHGQEAARLFAGHKDIRTTMTYLRDRRPNIIRPLARRAST